MAKPRKIRSVNPDEKLKLCLDKILKMRFREVVAHENALFGGHDVESLHDMRVASRRLQALLKVFRSCFPGRAFKSQYAVIRTLIKSLGRVRECDVFIEMLEERMKPVQGKDRKTLEFLSRRYTRVRNDELKELQWTLRLLSQIRYKENFLYFVKRSI